MRSTHRPRLIAVAALAAVVVLGLATAACSDDKDGGSASDAKKVVVADQGFGESKIASQIYGQLLAANGYDVTYRSLKDRAATYAAFGSGDIDFEPDYAASALEFLNGNAGEATGQVDETVQKLQSRLDDKKLTALTPSKALDTNALVVSADNPKTKDVTSIDQLTPDMILGGPQDCPTNAGCIPALKSAYHIDMSKNFKPLDSSGPNTKAALENGDIDVAVIFSTDSSIAAKGWRVLDDPQKIFKADYIVPVLTDSLAKDTKLTKLADKVSAALTTSEITALNKRFDIDKEDAEVIAKDFLTSKKLL
jgi:osmoprotectant transport system substrate-binding protein